MLSGHCQRWGRTGAEHLPPSCGSLGALELWPGLCSGAGSLHLQPQAVPVKTIRRVTWMPALIWLFLVSLSFFKLSAFEVLFCQQCGHLECGCSGELNAAGWIFLPCQCVSFGQQGCSEFFISALEPVGWLGTSPEPGDAELLQFPRAFVLPWETGSPSRAQFAVGVGREQLIVGTCCKHCWLPKLVPCLPLFKNNGMLCSSGSSGTSGAVRATWLLRCCAGNALSRKRLKKIS